MTTKGLVFFLLMISLTSCSIEKRRYMKGYYIDRVSHSSLKSAETKEDIHDKEQSPSYVEEASTAECSALDESLSSQTLCTQHELEEAGKSGLIKQLKRNKNRIIPKSIKGAIRHHMGFQTPLKSSATVKRGGDVLDVATVIFGLYFLISLAFAVLFFIAALFAKDAFSLAVFLFIGGSFFVISLVFMVIWLLLRRKSAEKG
jgi:hypothetical protein